jgi:hypothetical protein
MYHSTLYRTTSGNFETLSKTASASLQLPTVNPQEVLMELCALLEEHAPTWYAEEQRERALAARRPPAEVAMELVALLEEYAPTWYTEEQRDRTLALCESKSLLANRQNNRRV